MNQLEEPETSLWPTRPVLASCEEQHTLRRLDRPKVALVGSNRHRAICCAKSSHVRGMAVFSRQLCGSGSRYAMSHLLSRESSTTPAWMHSRGGKPMRPEHFSPRDHQREVPFHCLTRCDECPTRESAVVLSRIPLRIVPPSVRSPHQPPTQGQPMSGQQGVSKIGTDLETQRQWFLENFETLKKMTWKIMSRCGSGLSRHDQDNVGSDAVSFLWQQMERGKCRATEKKVFFAWSRRVVRRKVVELAQGIQKQNRFAQSLDNAKHFSVAEETTALDELVLDRLALIPDEDRRGKSTFEVFWMVTKKLLPPEQAKAFWYRFDGQMSYKEIGQRLGMASATAKRRVMGATRRLRQILKDYLPGRQ